MKRLYFFVAVLLCVIMASFTACAVRANAQSAAPAVSQPAAPGQSSSRLYFTSDISPAGLMAVYEALGRQASGKVAVKIHTGEPGNTHYVKPELMKNLVQKVNGTFVEANTAYGGRRASSAAHYQVAQDHGFAAVAPVVIMDERADISLPVSGGRHLKENLVGARINEFDFHIVISHFKGHQMGGYGGALKNLSIGYASSAGKSLIHTAGRSRSGIGGGDQNSFLESMAEAAKTITDKANGRILYINVMNHLSVDCDCSGRPAAPTMADIGILASLDPVALDQACIDLVYSAPDSKNLIARIESRNGLLTISHAETLGIGSRKYELIKL